MHVFLAVCSVLLPCCSSTQPVLHSPTDTPQMLFAIDGKFKLFEVDNLQNIYLFDERNELVKYTADGREQFRYPNSTLGTIASIDASNPLLLLVFFPDYQNVLLLDRTLSPAGQFNLFRAGLFEVTAVAMATDNHLWAFDAAEFRLKKLDRFGEVLLQSADLSLVLGKTIRPIAMREHDQQVFVNDPKEGILVFDAFGKYLKTLPLKEVTDFHFAGTEMRYLQKGQFKAFDLQLLQERAIQLPDEVKQPKTVRVVGDRLFVLTAAGLKAYRL